MLIDTIEQFAYYVIIDIVKNLILTFVNSKLKKSLIFSGVFLVGFFVAVLLMIFARGGVGLSNSDAAVLFTREGDRRQQEYCEYLADVQNNCGGGFSGASCRVQVGFFREVVMGCPSQID